MSQPPDENAALQPTLTLPSGGVARRCQARKKDGAQCGNPARDGFPVCPRHGAGFPSREATGEKKPVGTGRPPVTGAHSKFPPRSISDLRAEMQDGKADPDQTETAMLTLHATLEWLLSRSDHFTAKLEELEAVSKVLEDAGAAHLREAELTPDELGRPDRDLLATGKACLSAVGSALKLLAQVQTWTDRLTDTGSRVLKGAKERAETRAKNAETKALEMFLDLAGEVRNIVWDLGLDDDSFERFEDEVRRRLLAPNRLTLEPRTPPQHEA